MHSSRGTARSPSGYVSRRSALRVNGRRRRSSSETISATSSSRSRYSGTRSRRNETSRRSRSSWSASSSGRGIVSNSGSKITDPLGSLVGEEERPPDPRLDAEVLPEPDPVDLGLPEQVRHLGHGLEVGDVCEDVC